jgi:hypothetical protein
MSGQPGSPTKEVDDTFNRLMPGSAVSVAGFVAVHRGHVVPFASPRWHREVGLSLESTIGDRDTERYC